MTDTLRLELPLPDKILSPNARPHYYARNAATQRAKNDVVVAVLEQRPRGKPFATATVTVTFIVPDHRRRDHGNLIASAKAYIDGLTVAGVIPDDSRQFITESYPPIIYEKGVRKTIIEVEEKP